MKEFEKLLFEEEKRTENAKAINQIKLGLFEQKEEETFDFSNYTKMTYNKKYKGLYDLYRSNETYELCFVCPLVEDNKGSDDEVKDMKPYAYDVLYLEYLDNEAYELVKKAAVHEKSRFIDCLYVSSFVMYFVLIALNIFTLVYLLNESQAFASIILVMGSLVSALVVSTILLPILLIKYRKFKAQ